jgi:hypothetical protein
MLDERHPQLVQVPPAITGAGATPSKGAGALGNGVGTGAGEGTGAGNGTDGGGGGRDSGGNVGSGGSGDNGAGSSSSSSSSSRSGGLFAGARDMSFTPGELAAIRSIALSSQALPLLTHRYNTNTIKHYTLYNTNYIALYTILSLCLPKRSLYSHTGI